MATAVGGIEEAVVGASSSLVGFAVLRANYQAEAPSYVDNFRGFVLGVLSEHRPDALTREALASQIRSSFGIIIPDLVVGKILKRAKHAGWIAESAGAYTLTAQGLKRAPAVTADRDKYLRQQTDLEDRFRAFVEAEFADHNELLGASLAEELGRYLEHHAVPLIANSVRGRSLRVVTSSEGVPGFDYVIARFVAHLAERDTTGFGYLEDAAKGAILAAVVSLDTSSKQTSLSDLSVYVDTPVLIDLLGYSGSTSMQATHQLLGLAHDLGAKVRVFEHSLRELDGVLEGAEQYSRRPGNREARRIDLHFQDEGWSAADIQLARQAVPQALEALSLIAVPKPEGYSEYGLDETQLDRILQDTVHYKSAYTKRFDVDSLSAIHRLRRGSSRGTLERCKAILLTNNSELVRAVFALEDERHEWPLAITDTSLAGLLWARSPTMARDLPRKAVIAAAYAGMQPDNNLWGLYVAEVDALELRGAVSSDEAITLRSTSMGRAALMDETLGDAVNLTNESPIDVLGRLRSGLEAPVLARLEDGERDAENARVVADQAAESWLARDSEARDLARQLQEERERTASLSAAVQRSSQARDLAIADVRRRAAKYSRFIVGLGLWIVVVPMGIFTVLQLVPEPPFQDVPWVKPVSICVTALVAILTILDTIGQGNVKQWLAPVERKLAEGLHLRAMRKVDATNPPLADVEAAADTPADE